MRILAGFLVWSGLVVLLLGHGGAWHGLGDSLAVGRLPLGLFVAGLGVVLLPWRRVTGLAGLAGGVLAAGPILWAMWVAPQPGAHLHYQKNLLFVNQRADAVLADIRATRPDVVTLQEVSPATRPVFDGLGPDFATRLDCSDGRAVGVALASRWPAIAGSATCIGGNRAAAVRVDAPGGPLWIVSLHLAWPWPYDQRAQAAELRTALARLEGPVLVGGDFNMVPWGRSVRGIARAVGARPAGPVRASYAFPSGWPNIPIDHVLVPRGRAARAETRGFDGSDHRGVLVRFEG